MVEWLLAITVCYLLTVAIESAVLIPNLSKHHKLRDKIFAGFWLTACTYPVVNVLIPLWLNPLESRALYLIVAETFAPLAECFLFWLAFGRAQSGGKPLTRDCIAIVLANLSSFAAGECLHALGWLDLLH